MPKNMSPAPTRIVRFAHRWAGVRDAPEWLGAALSAVRLREAGNPRAAEHLAWEYGPREPLLDLELVELFGYVRAKRANRDQLAGLLRIDLRAAGVLAWTAGRSRDGPEQ